MSLDWLTAPDGEVARLILQRGLGAIYLVAFWGALRQFRPLLGEHGLLPVPGYLAGQGFRQVPTIFQLGYTDRRLALLAWAGIAGSALIVVGLPDGWPLPAGMVLWAALWFGYLSIVNVGQTFYGFGWESLLCEAGFLAIFLGNAAIGPPVLALLAFRWLAFRVEFGAGLIKLRGDPCWRDLSCMDYHHETQPMPNPVSWFIHRLPRPLHRVEVLGNFGAQLAAPLLLFFPQPIAGIGAAWMILTQLYLVATGNYAWLNWITIVVTASALPDAWFTALLTPRAGQAMPAWFGVATIGLALLVVVLSYEPVRNLLGRRQRMNFSFNAYHLVNAYGAFGSVTRVRDEVVVEGTDEAVLLPQTRWRAYEFRGKPGDPRRLPPQVAPYHLRIDWLMWFLPLSPAYGMGWFDRFLERLLVNDPAMLGLLRGNPFPDRPPVWVRARRFRYRFSTWRELRSEGAWWVREPIGDYLPPTRLRR